MIETRNAKRPGVLAQCLYAILIDDDPVDKQAAMVAIADRMFTLDRILEAMVVMIKTQNNTNKLLRALGGRRG